YAKWPIFLLAIYDALRQYRGPYTITRKARTKSRHSALLIPHLLIVGLTASAWMIGMMFGRITNPLLHISAAIIVLSSLSLILTEQLNFPDPYDPDLQTKEMAS